MTLISLIKLHKKSCIITAILALAVVVIVAVALAVVLPRSESANKGVVVSNGYCCSSIGVDIMKKGGNAVDAAIATLFCEGVTLPQSMGLGGGFLMTIYNRTTREVHSLNARETAPEAATEDMFHGDPNLSLNGGLSVAIPGELAGYWSAYQKYGGGVAWKELVQPSIDLCKQGIYVTKYMAKVLKDIEDDLYADPVLRQDFLDPSTNETYLEGDYFTRPTLAKTLEIISEEGGYAINNGSLTANLVKDIRDNNGIITVEDMRNYRPVWQTSIRATLAGNNTLYSAPLPGSGIILAFILNILDGILDTTNHFSITNYQRIIESFKFAYAKRTELGDVNDSLEINQLIANLTSRAYAEGIRSRISDNSTSQDGSYYGATKSLTEDHGTAHISVLAPNGDAVSVTSTINYIFGAKFASNSTGIILNDQMDDFSSPNITNVYGVPPSPSNYIRPGRRPMSSMTPSIVVDGNGDVLMVIIKHLWFGINLKESSESKRFHHQLFPMKVDLEDEFRTQDTYVAEGLAAIGHNVSFSPSGSGFAAVTCISTNKGQSIVGYADKRRTGSATYFN
ncbi:unnamed protein product [Phaedon cochleariae]|uniref:Uncharacterized protein n=1 Tax=Phaedon cochleariae TaxID=80249 RepID=A0A9N9X0B3_PHACE|nr:unnamed protein product [Phaedon cochleariae]